MASRIPGRRLTLLALAWLAACQPASTPPRPQPMAAAADPAAFWNAATIYFLLIDRFQNGDPSNDAALGRGAGAAPFRGFAGGDLRGILQRLEAGYFDSLGVTAIWMTPFAEQIRGGVDEGTGTTYGYHGYWTRDWTAVDPAYGTVADLQAVVRAAHRRGIRVLMDAVINHTGPVTALDEAWPSSWVRTAPRCTYQSYVTTADCTLVANLPDLLTDSDAPVELPSWLLEKWRAEGRLERELQELEDFFRRTGHPRAPRFYLIKWLTDWVRDFGIDGYRVDTAKHFGETVSAELHGEAVTAFADWKRTHPKEALDDQPFFMLGEVYGYEAWMGRWYDFGNRKVDYFAHGYDGLINFGFKQDVRGSLEGTFSAYARMLREAELRGVTLVNYLTSHDDGAPFDRERADPEDAALRLLLAPGAAQIYYGDEIARPLNAAGADGDANLRTPMPWERLEDPRWGRQLLGHWRRLGQFRREHPAIGAGSHQLLQAAPYVFARRLERGPARDRVVVGLGFGGGTRTMPVGDVWPEGTLLHDGYGGGQGTVRNGNVTLPPGAGPILLAAVRPGSLR